MIPFHTRLSGIRVQTERSLNKRIEEIEFPYRFERKCVYLSDDIEGGPLNIDRHQWPSSRMSGATSNT